MDTDRNKPSSPPRPAQRRLDLREALWPRHGERIWDRHKRTGFCTIPRLLPLVMILIRELARKKSGVGDPSFVYFDLWTRGFDEGTVSIKDDAECAYTSGYTGTRATRSWRERIELLQELGFIDTKPAHNREHAHVLLFDPINVCAELRKKRDVPDKWWNAFVGRAQEIGAAVPDLDDPD